jgi:hypothetical protein
MNILIFLFPVILIQRRIKGPEVAAEIFYSTLRASAGLMPVALNA